MKGYQKKSTKLKKLSLKILEFLEINACNKTKKLVIWLISIIIFDLK